MLSDARRSSVLRIEPSPIALDCPSEHRPLNPTDETAFLPGLSAAGASRSTLIGSNFSIDPLDDLFASCDPLVPISPHERSGISLFLEQLNSVVQFAHALGYLLGGLRDPEVAWSEGASVEELFETAVEESAEQAGTDPLPSEAFEDLQFVVPVDQMLDLWPVDSE